MTFLGGAGGALIRFLSEVLVARNVSVAEFGLYGLLFNLIAILTHVLSGGPRSVVQRYLAILHHTRHYYHGHKLFAHSILFLVVLGPFLALAVIAFGPEVASMVGNPRLDEYIVFAAMATPMLSAVYVLTDYFRATGAVRYYNVIQEVIPGLLYMAILLSIYFMDEFSLYGILVAYLTSLAATLTIGARWYHKVARFEDADTPEPRFPDFLNHALFSVLLFGAWIFRERVAIFVVGAKLNPEDVAYYFVALRFLLSISLIRAALNSLLMPRVSAIYYEGNLDGLQKIYSTINRWMFIAIFPFVIFISFFPGEIAELVFGSEYAGVTNVVLTMLIIQILSLFTGASSTILQMTGRQHYEVLFQVLSAFAIFGASFLMADIFGLVGAAGGAFGAMWLFDVLRAVYVWRVAGVLPASRRQLAAMGFLFALWCVICLIVHLFALSVLERAMALALLGCLVGVGLARFCIEPSERRVIKEMAVPS